MKFLGRQARCAFPLSFTFNIFIIQHPVFGVNLATLFSKKCKHLIFNTQQVYYPNDNSLRVNINGRNYENRFNLDMVPGGPENRCKAYINDLKTISATVRTENGAIKVKLAFESDGVELITNCYNNGCCEGNPFCPGAGCPDYELNNSKIDISIIPRIAGGRLTYDSDVNFYVEVAESGYNDPCKNSFWAFLCDLGWVPNRTSRENKIKQGIDTQIRNWFQNDASIRLALETLLNSNINVSGYSTITIDGSGNIVLN